MSKKKSFYLSEIQGMIANCAIENNEHDKAYKKCQELIDKFGLLAKIDWEIAMKYCYGEEVNK